MANLVRRINYDANFEVAQAEAFLLVSGLSTNDWLIRQNNVLRNVSNNKNEICLLRLGNEAGKHRYDVIYFLWHALQLLNASSLAACFIGERSNFFSGVRAQAVGHRYRDELLAGANVVRSWRRMAGTLTLAPASQLHLVFSGLLDKAYEHCLVLSISEIVKIKTYFDDLKRAAS